MARASGHMQVISFGIKDIWVKDIGRPTDNLFHVRTHLRYGCMDPPLLPGHGTREPVSRAGPLQRQSWPSQLSESGARLLGTSQNSAIYGWIEFFIIYGVNSENGKNRTLIQLDLAHPTCVDISRDTPVFGQHDVGRWSVAPVDACGVTDLESLLEAHVRCSTAPILHAQHAHQTHR